MNQATRPPIECLAVDAPDEREPVAEFAALRSTHGGSSNHSVEGPHNNNHCERSDKPITHCYFLPLILATQSSLRRPRRCLAREIYDQGGQPMQDLSAGTVKKSVKMSW
jgi:hypothetical protein